MWTHHSATPTDTLPRFFILLLMMESLEEMPTPVTGLRLAVTSKPSPNMQHQKPHAPHHEQHLIVQSQVITFSIQAGTTVHSSSLDYQQLHKAEHFKPLKNIMILCET
jgi:hypothetical protein